MATEFTCIVCPNGCRLSVEEKDGELVVSGAFCKKGQSFAKQELTNPTRSITTTVATVFPDMPLLSVKTDGEIPKDKIFDAMKKINKVTVKKRLPVGGIVLKNVFGVNVVATTDMKTSSTGKRVSE